MARDFTATDIFKVGGLTNFMGNQKRHQLIPHVQCIEFSSHVIFRRHFWPTHNNHGTRDPR